ncbi:gp152 [Bacillus phage W.Ph.]|uniref:Gp152 n=1 Tax=Bacillus phage W.Ph. TaxID=764595 RepID=G9B1Q3_9CAUD|nr:gp152 [Bacillus phage W.Ph.]ADH03298.1 gp152 [Bacillus phage W.Ph.]
MKIEERQAAVTEVERILSNIKSTEEFIKEYKDMLYNNSDEIDVIGCARWLLSLKEELKDHYYELENYLESTY